MVPVIFFVMPAIFFVRPLLCTPRTAVDSLLRPGTIHWSSTATSTILAASEELISGRRCKAILTASKIASC